MANDSIIPPLSRFSCLTDLTLVVTIVAIMLTTTLNPSLVPEVVLFSVGAGFILFLPGYTFTAALFPAAYDDGLIDMQPERCVTEPGLDGSVSPATRALLSLGLSVASVPLVGLLLNFTPWGIYRETVLTAIGALTLLFVAIAGYRRLQLSSKDRFTLRISSWPPRVRDWATGAETEFEMYLNVALVVCLLLAMVGATFVVVNPTEGERYTEFYLLSQDPETDTLVADNYPEQFEIGERQQLVIGIHNQEGGVRNYTVVILLQRVQFTNDSVAVLETSQLNRFDTSVAQNDTWQRQHMVTPDMAGKDLRLTYLLYVNDPPENVSTDTAYRHTHIWVNVSELSAGTS